jgi:hypothetical protein
MLILSYLHAGHKTGRFCTQGCGIGPHVTIIGSLNGLPALPFIPNRTNLFDVQFVKALMQSTSFTPGWL